MSRFVSIIPHTRIMEMANRRLKPKEHNLVLEEIHGEVIIASRGSYMDTTQMEQETKYRDAPLSKQWIGLSVLGAACGVGIGAALKNPLVGIGSMVVLGSIPMVVETVLTLRTRIRVLSWEKEMLQRSAVIIHALRENTQQQLVDRYNHLRRNSTSWFLKEHDEQFTSKKTSTHPTSYAISQTKH